jgi:hypothetical protein
MSSTFKEQVLNKKLRILLLHAWVRGQVNFFAHYIKKFLTHLGITVWIPLLL